MFDKSSVTQSGNNASGDIIAGDQININFPTPALSRLTLLLQKFQAEQENDIQTKQVIDELLRYQEPRTPSPVGLEKKLEDGGRLYQVDYALEAKEAFVKKLARNTLFESAQEIHAMVLGKIHSVFRTQISSLISQNMPLDVVDKAIQLSIIDPLVTELQQTSFRYHDQEVWGMLYYLTWNCYIRWD